MTIYRNSYDFLDSLSEEPAEKRFVVDSYGKVRQVSPEEAEAILNDGGREATDPEIRAWYTGRKQTPPS